MVHPKGPCTAILYDMLRRQGAFYICIHIYICIYIYTYICMGTLGPKYLIPSGSGL